MRSYLGAGFKRRLLGLCAPPFVLGLIDGSLTLVGQSSFYWANYQAVNEANPVFSSLLQVHPLVFLAGVVVWQLMLCAMLLVLPEVLALILSIAFTFGYTIGSGSWLFERLELGYHLANGYYLLSACVLGLGIRYAIGRDAPAAEVLKVSAEMRLKVGIGVVALGALLWLYPWQA